MLQLLDKINGLAFSASVVSSAEFGFSALIGGWAGLGLEETIISQKDYNIYAILDDLRL